MDNRDVLTLLALATSIMIVTVVIGGSAIVFCGKKKKQYQKLPLLSLKKSQGLKSMSNRVSITQPLLQSQLLTATVGSFCDKPEVNAIPSGTLLSTNLVDKAGLSSEVSKPPEQSKGDKKNNVEKCIDSNKKPEGSGGIDKKNHNLSRENKFKENPKNASVLPVAPSSPSPAPTAPNEDDKRNAKEASPPPRGMEIHKSMKVQNKKQGVSNAAHKAATPLVIDKPPEGKKSSNCDLKNTDGDDDDEDDDETLRGVTSLKIDTKVPFSGDDGIA